MSLGLKPLSGKQLRSVHLAERRLNVWEGSVRSGKSVACDLRWLSFVRYGPPGNLLMAGKTERTLKRNVIDPLVDILGRGLCSYSLGSGELQLLGRRVYVAGANDERAQEKVRGLTLVGAYVDEASTLPETFFKMLLSRLSVDGARLFATTNPDGPAHWLKAEYLDRCALHLRGDGELAEPGGELDLARFSFRLADNAHLAPDYVAAICREYTGLWHKRFIEGEWCIAAGAVYDGWDPDRHMVKAAKLPDIARLLSVGIDYGTNHPTRGYLIGVSAESSPRLVVLDEWAPGVMTDAGYSADFRRWLGTRQPEWICVDPAAASFKLQLFSDGLSNVMNASNAVLGGIRTIASLLATDRLIVSDACVELAKELPSYVWDPKATARGEDAPVKANDDCCDALRYAVATTRQLWGSLVPMTIPADLEEAA